MQCLTIFYIEDAKVANKILNKIQNPVYPDDVDVANQ